MVKISRNPRFKTGLPIIASFTVYALAFAAIQCTQSRADEPAERLSVAAQGFVVVVIQEASVPSMIAGPLAELSVTEGDTVEPGAVLATIDPRRAEIQHAHTMHQLAIAEEHRDHSREVEIAGAKLEEELQLVREHQARQNINRRKSSNDLRVQASQKAEAVARNELERANRARETFVDAVSESEIEGLQLAYERSQLETLQAEFDRQMDLLAVDIDDVIAESYRLRVKSAHVAVAQAESSKRVVLLESRIRKEEAALAALLVEQHRVRSPIQGVVVEVNRRVGDWVEMGESVARVIRIDRLRAEGFLPASRRDLVLDAEQLCLELQLPDGSTLLRTGDRRFVSPEVDPVTNEVHCWVEFDNLSMDVQPGVRAAVILNDPGTQP